MKYKTVLFDLDGTLIDTNELILSSFLHTLHHFYPERSFERKDIIPIMGQPLWDMFAHFGAKQKMDDMVRVYREHNLRTHDEMVEAFPYVQEVLDKLAQHEVNMGIVTTKQRNTAEMGLRLCELERYMQTLVTINDVHAPKPDPEPVQKAIAELGADPDETLMVGDSRYDIEAAHRAGIAAAGVSWSMKGEEHLQSFSPEHMLRDMRELLPVVGISQESS